MLTVIRLFMTHLALSMHTSIYIYIHIQSHWDKLRYLKTKENIYVQLKERGTLYRTAEDIQKQKCVT